MTKDCASEKHRRLVATFREEPAPSSAGHGPRADKEAVSCWPWAPAWPLWPPHQEGGPPTWDGRTPPDRPSQSWRRPGQPSEKTSPCPVCVTLHFLHLTFQHRGEFLFCATVGLRALALLYKHHQFPYYFISLGFAR